jgi:hypothetical protein
VANVKLVFALLYLVFSVWCLYLMYKVAGHVGAWPFG